MKVRGKAIPLNHGVEHAKGKYIIVVVNYARGLLYNGVRRIQAFC